MRRPVLAVAAAFVAVGVGLRWWVLRGDIALLDADEGVVGLQAIRAAHGDEATFFLGQHYGGTLEALLASVPIRVVGAHVLALRSTMAAVSTVSVGLLYLLARRTVGRRAAVVAAAMLFAWPAVYVWFGTRTLGFYTTSLALGLGTCLLVTVVADDPRPRWYALLGLVAGLAWWQSPYLVYFAVPSVLWLVAHQRWTALARLPLAVPTAALGAAPWLLANVGKGFPSLDTGTYGGYAGTYLGKVWYVLHTGLPVAVGLKQPYTSFWARGDVGRWTYLALLAALAAVVVVAVARRRLAAFGIVAFPFLYALNPVGTTSAHGRYFLFLSPWLALLAGEVAARTRPRLAAVAVAVAATTVLGVDVLASLPWRAMYRPPTDDVVAQLREDDVGHVYADYFLAYKLAFESEGEVRVAPFTAVRDQAEAAAVRAAPDVAYVFSVGDGAVDRALAGFDRAGVDVAVRRLDDYLILLPERPVPPEQLDPAPLGV